MEPVKEKWGFIVTILILLIFIFTYLMIRESKILKPEYLFLEDEKDVTHGTFFYNYHYFNNEINYSNNYEIVNAVNIEKDNKNVIIDNVINTKVIQKNYIYHNVKKGDSLWRIARKYNVKISDLIRYNNIRNPDMIYQGSTIKVYVDT